LIINYNLGLEGACIASGVTYFLNFALITIKCYMSSDLEESFFLPNKESFDGMIDYLKIGIPMALQVTLDYMIVEVQNLLSSLISIVANAAMVIVLNAQILLFMFSFCLMISANVFVGKSMGANDPH
jgi:Na+-driven multidrug efflux pump